MQIESKRLKPIVLFVYNRLTPLQNLLKSLNLNPECVESDLIIFSDGSKEYNLDDISDVQKVRNYIKDIRGFKSVKIFESNTNKGLANSIIDGLNTVSKNFDSFIVLEDDLIVSSHFLNYMNTSLNKYKNNSKVWSINGFGIDPKQFNLPNRLYEDFYWTIRPSSHGWGTWSNRWNQAIWNEKELSNLLKLRKNRKKVIKAGSDIFSMFEEQLKNNIDSWGVRWVINACINNKFSLNPIYSYTLHQFSAKSTHIKSEDKKMKVDLFLANSDFSFPKKVKLNKKIIKNLQIYIYGPTQFEKFFYYFKSIFYKLKIK